MRRQNGIPAWLIGGWLAVAAAVFGGWPVAAATAQVYPHEDTLDELAERAERLARQQDLDEERARQLAELAGENRERWSRFQQQMRRKLRDIQNAGRRGESNELRQSLNRVGRAYEIGTILLALGDGRAAEQFAVTAERALWEQPVVLEGWLDVLILRAGLIRHYSGDWNQTRANRLERLIEMYDANLTQRLDGSTGQARRRREQRHDEFRAWMRQVPGYIDQRQTLLTMIEQDTFDGERIWQLAQLLANNLYQHAEARAWLELLIEHCSDHWTVRSGLAQAGLAKVLASQGWLQQAREMISGCANTCQRFFDGIPDEVRPLQERVQQALADGKPINLTPMERWLLAHADGRARNERRGALMNRLRALTEETNQQIEEYENAAGAR